MQYRAADMLKPRFIQIHAALKGPFGLSAADLRAFVNEQDDERQRWIESAHFDEVIDWIAGEMHSQG